MTPTVPIRVRALAAAALLSAAASPAAAQPNLTPVFNPFSGQVSVQNTNGDPAPGSWVTIECSGDCPEPPAAQLGPYLNPGFSNKLSIAVPALPGFQSFQHNVSFWNDLNFPAGTAQFAICTDAAGGIAESSERDNCLQVLRRQKAPKKAIAVPTQKLRLKH